MHRLIRRESESYSSTGSRILDRYVQFYNAGDMVNALELWNEHVPHYFRHIVHNADGKAHDFRKPSIVSSFMPKSGGTFIHNRMTFDLGYKEFWWCVTAASSASDVYVSRRGLEAFLLGGFACHTHMLPTPQTLREINSIYREKIWVHIRNPIECAISSYHHYKGQSQGEGAIYDERMREAAREIERFALNLTDIDAFARQHVHFFVRWLSEWAEYDQLSPGRVFLTFFDELKSPEKLFQRVMAQYDGDIAVELITERLDSDRKRTTNEIREELSAPLMKELREFVATELRGFKYLDRLQSG